MPPKARTTKATKPAAEKPVEAPVEQGEVFTYVQLVSTLSGRLDTPGPSNAAVMAALNAGYRPTGDPSADVKHDTERMQATVTWSIPVQRASDR